MGAEPTALNRTLTFGFSNPPASWSAAVASNGSWVRTTEAIMVRGRSGSCSSSSGIGDGFWGVIEPDMVAVVYRFTLGYLSVSLCIMNLMVCCS